MNSICIFCGSRSGYRTEYGQAARDLAALLVERGIQIVYGAGSVGLMGILADEALTRGGRVVGVIPEHLCNREVLHDNLSELHVTASLLERKLLMMELADGFVALPGGLGTYDEILEVCTWFQLGRHQKPIALVNSLGYFDPFFGILDRAIEEGFLDSSYRDDINVVSDSPSFSELLDQWLTGPG